MDINPNSPFARILYAAAGRLQGQPSITLINSTKRLLVITYSDNILSITVTEDLGLAGKKRNNSLFSTMTCWQ